MTVLSSKAILAAMKRNKIIIDPFDQNNLENVSYDVTLGDNFFKPKDIQPWELVPLGSGNIRDIFEGPLELKTAQRAADEMALKLFPLFDPTNNDLGVVIMPGGRVLAHTKEFVGSNSPEFTTKIFDRSTATRLGVSVVSGAGCGDPGFINRWALEIKNENKFPFFIRAGCSIAQIQFWKVDKPSTIKSTSYQDPNLTIKELKKRWKPEDILPKHL